MAMFFFNKGSAERNVSILLQVLLDGPPSLWKKKNIGNCISSAERPFRVPQRTTNRLGNVHDYYHQITAYVRRRMDFFFDELKEDSGVTISGWVLMIYSFRLNIFLARAASVDADLGRWKKSLWQMCLFKAHRGLFITLLSHRLLKFTFQPR